MLATSGGRGARLFLPFDFALVQAFKASRLAGKHVSKEVKTKDTMPDSHDSMSRPWLVRVVTTCSRLSKKRSFLRRQAASKKTVRSMLAKLDSDAQLMRSLYPASATSSGCSGRSRSLATDH